MENPCHPIKTFERTFSHCHRFPHSDICLNTEKDNRLSKSKFMFFWVVSPSFECLSLDPSMLVQSLMINPALCDALPHFTPCHSRDKMWMTKDILWHATVWLSPKMCSFHSIQMLDSSSDCLTTQMASINKGYVSSSPGEGESERKSSSLSQVVKIYPSQIPQFAWTHFDNWFGNPTNENLASTSFTLYPNYF